jgi:universal stress protein A
MTLKMNQIVCATDFSETSHRAIEYATELTDKFRAELHLLHVVHDPATELPAYGEGLVFPGYLEQTTQRLEELEAAAFRHLKPLIDPEWASSHRVAFAVEHGVPFVEIIRFAKSVAADLIVLGTHGRTGLKHMLLGSVAERVVQHAPCAVLTVRPEHHQFEMP